MLNFPRERCKFNFARLLIAHALDQAGFAFLAAQFYDFCKDVLFYALGDDGNVLPRERAYMLHKYTPDRLLGSNWMALVDEKSAFLPIQEDETAIIPFVLWKRYLKFRDVENVGSWFRPLLIHTTNFLCEFRDAHTGLPAPSVDLWEEHRGIYAYTTATV